MDLMDARERFAAFYAAHLRQILGFATRRSETADDAADVASEVFMTAWPRLDELPPGDEARLWLYGVARRVLANHRRAHTRRARLGRALANAWADAAASDPTVVNPAEVAGWAATPTLATGTTNTELAAQCQDIMHTSAPAVILEKRGASNLTVLADSSECLNAQGDDIPGALITGGQGFVPAEKPGPDEVQVLQADSLGAVGPGDTADQGEPIPATGYMGVFGQVGSAVENVVIHTPDHGDVTASIDNGWFAAWWPPRTRPTSLTVTTATGSHVVRDLEPWTP